MLLASASKLSSLKAQEIDAHSEPFCFIYITVETTLQGLLLNVIRVASLLLLPLLSYTMTIGVDYRKCDRPDE